MKCQIMTLPEIAEDLSRIQIFLQRLRKLRCTIRRRKNYLCNLFREIKERKDRRSSSSDSIRLKAGDLVRVKSQAEIRKTLDRWNQLKGCGFMDEMWQYCGTSHRVLKSVQRFLDERDYLIKKCNGIVILEGVYCEGTKDFGPCDRCCYYFWREEWLEKIPDVKEIG